MHPIYIGKLYYAHAQILKWCGLWTVKYVAVPMNVEFLKSHKAGQYAARIPGVKEFIDLNNLFTIDLKRYYYRHMLNVFIQPRYLCLPFLST